MKTNIYDFSDYITYLKWAIKNKSSEVKGIKLKLARAIDCHPSYLSQALAKKVNLNLEQGVKVNTFLNHDKMESRFFLWLIEYARAGNMELKEFFKEQLEIIIEQRTHLKNRIKNTENVNLEHQHKYYSTWYYSAIYVSLSIPQIQKPIDIVKLLNLPIAIVHEAIQFLKESGLIIEQKGQLQVTKKNIHLNKDSDFIKRHHINWRSKALQSVEINLNSDLHYSSVLAIHEKDFKKLREHFITAITNSKKIIVPSPEQNIYAFTLDLFEI